MVRHCTSGRSSGAINDGWLNAGRSHVEDITDGQLGEALATGRCRVTADTDDLAGFDVAVISVPTPMGEGIPDLSFIESAAATLAPHVRSGSTVILESATYPGTTEELVAPILESGLGLRAGADFYLGYSPERIDPGNVKWRLENTPKVVSGVDGPSRIAPYLELLPGPIAPGDTVIASENLSLGAVAVSGKSISPPVEPPLWTAAETRSRAAIQRQLGNEILS